MFHAVLLHVIYFATRWCKSGWLNLIDLVIFSLIDSIIDQGLWVLFRFLSLESILGDFMCFLSTILDVENMKNSKRVKVQNTKSGFIVYTLWEVFFVVFHVPWVWVGVFEWTFLITGNLWVITQECNLQNERISSR